jgi:hypothetical protein
VEASAVKPAAAMEGERTSPTVPNHCESTAAESTSAESTSAESATHRMRAHAATRTHPATVPAAVSTPVSAAATRGCNGWGKGDRRTDRGGGGKDHHALSEHGSVPP